MILFNKKSNVGVSYGKFLHKQRNPKIDDVKLEAISLLQLYEKIILKFLL